MTLDIYWRLQLSKGLGHTRNFMFVLLTSQWPNISIGVMVRYLSTSLSIKLMTPAGLLIDQASWFNEYAIKRVPHGTSIWQRFIASRFNRIQFELSGHFFTHYTEKVDYLNNHLCPYHSIETSDQSVHSCFPRFCPLIATQLSGFDWVSLSTLWPLFFLHWGLLLIGATCMNCRNVSHLLSWNTVFVFIAELCACIIRCVD